MGYNKVRVADVERSVQLGIIEFSDPPEWRNTGCMRREQEKFHQVHAHRAVLAIQSYRVKAGIPYDFNKRRVWNSQGTGSNGASCRQFLLCSRVCCDHQTMENQGK